MGVDDAHLKHTGLDLKGIRKLRWWAMDGDILCQGYVHQEVSPMLERIEVLHWS